MSNFGVHLITADDLSEEELKVQPDNGSGKDYASYLKIYHKGYVVGIFSDAMEPEDARFLRDMSWISGALERAYNLGFKDGQNEIHTY